VARVANIGLAVVLAALASLLVLGCGGDDSSATETAGTSTAASQEAAAQEGSGAPTEGPGSKKFAEERAAAEAAIEGKAPAGKSSAGKQGPSIRPPKGPREPAATPQQRAEAIVADMSLQSPVLGPGPESISPLPPTYTCDGKDTPPPLAWRGVPAGTEELILFSINLEPVNETLFFNWALAGIDPALESLDSERPPKDAVAGLNSFGRLDYSICPPSAGGPETVIFVLYALPESLGARKGFDPMALRKEVLERSGNSGILAVSYGRG
jgi:phosphatidylethanolamine-binding protein (PEBP) family uncharacterized protein